MDQKALASPELRTQHILSLHQEQLENKIQIATLEQALARVSGLNKDHWEERGGESDHGTSCCVLGVCFCYLLLSDMSYGVEVSLLYRIWLYCDHQHLLYIFFFLIFTSETGHDNVFDSLQADLRAEQTHQALRVEKLLQSAIMQTGN